MRQPLTPCLLILIAGLSATALPGQTATVTPPEPASEWPNLSSVQPTITGPSTNCAPLSNEQSAAGDLGPTPGSTGDTRLQVPCASPNSAAETGAVPLSHAESAIPAAPQTALPADAMRRAESEARAAALASSLKEPEETQPLRGRLPYRNIPALRDLYTQVPSAGGTLRRFGSEAFLLGTGNANLLPSDLPVGPDYVLGVGDQLLVNMWGSHAERLNVTVDRQGQIALPEAGTLPVSGLTIAHAQEAVGRALNGQFKNEHAEISMGRLRTVRVYVVGDVQRPGAYDVNALSTPMSALYAAGGPTARGSLRLLKQVRGDRPVAQLDLYDFLLKGVRGGMDPKLSGCRATIIRAAEKLFSGPFEGVIAVSQDEVAYAAALGVEPIRIHLIPNGVDAASIRVKAGAGRRQRDAAKPVLGFLGRLVEQKDPSLFLRVVSGLVQRGHDVNAIVVGGGPMLPDLMQIAEQMQLSSRIEWMGAVPALNELANMDVLVHTSAYESLPYALLEAIAADVPVVAVGNAGSRALFGEFLPQSIVSQGTAEALADAVATVLQNQAVRQQYSESYAQIMERFSTRTMVDRTITVYNEALQWKGEQRTPFLAGLLPRLTESLRFSGQLRTKAQSTVPKLENLAPISRTR